LVVIAQKDFQQVEFSAVKQALEKNGYVVIVASNSKAEAIAMDKKTKVRPDIAIKDAKEKDYIGISIIGGNGSPKYLWNNKELIKLVKEFYENKKVVSAICLSPAVLAQADILKNKEATVFPSPEALDIFKGKGVKYKDKPVIRVDKIITGRDPQSAKSFAEELVKALKEK
ncbi:DJ-1/PfpI family protein, partial [bacterium]|nr:DJ-1/PfpI family protein [bacterium]